MTRKPNYYRDVELFIQNKQDMDWLNFIEVNSLYEDYKSYIKLQEDTFEKDLAMQLIFGNNVNRVNSLSADEIKGIRKMYGKKQISPEEVYRQYKEMRKSLRILDFDKLPADAIAFYRPFHFKPYNEWGIYIYTEKLINYCKTIVDQLANKAFIFSSLEEIISLVIFEIFNHEFFHHMVESAATTLEIIYSNLGESKKLYIDYLRNKYFDNSILGKHKHHPLEEALANAYAYNSLSFISRVTLGYKPISLKIYQKALEDLWKTEPPGYKYAESYINNGYLKGATMLLSMILGDIKISNFEAIAFITNNVILKGHSAFIDKPNIPVYLVGDAESLSRFARLVPAPNETYTKLFTPYDYSDIDTGIRKIREAEKAKK